MGLLLPVPRASLGGTSFSARCPKAQRCLRRCAMPTSSCSSSDLKRKTRRKFNCFPRCQIAGQGSLRAARFWEAGSSSSEIAVITSALMSIGRSQLFARYLRNAARWSSRRSRLVVLHRTAGQLGRRKIPMPRLPGTGNPNSRWSARSVASFQIGPISILRPPMILGPRDMATLPLFRMARGALRIKPGLRTKSYSFIAVDDLVTAIFLALESEPCPQASYVASAQSITDWQLIAAAAAACHARGVTVPVPHLVVRMLSAFVDTVPS